MGVFQGLAYNHKGWRFLKDHKHLWKYVLVPLLTNFFFLSLLASLYIYFFDELFAFVSSPLGSLDVSDPQTWYGHVLDFLMWFVRKIFEVLFFFLSLLILLLGVQTFAGLINAPFYEMIAEQILIDQGLREPEPFQWRRFRKDLVYGLKIELERVVFLFVLGAVFFMGSFIPVVGPFISLTWMLFTAWLFALGITCFPLVLQRRGFRDILSWGWQRKALLLGLGLPVLIPFVGLMAVFFQVVGGTLLFIDHRHDSQEAAGVNHGS